MQTILFLHGALVRTSRILLEGLSAFAAEQGWIVLNVAPPKCAKPNYLRRIAKSWDAAGIVVDCGVERSMPLPDGKLDVPVVCIDLDPQKRKKLLQRGARSINVAFVNADSDLFARMAANELLKHDFLSYAYVSAYSSRHWSERRRDVFRQVIESAGEALYIFDGKQQETGDSESSRRLGNWLSSLPKPCGLLAANDRIAALVLSAAQRYGISIPEMVSVIGIDNDDMLCENLSTSLSSINPDFFSGGYIAGQMLSKMISGAAPVDNPLLYGAKCFMHRLSTRRIERSVPSVKNALNYIHRHAAEGLSASDILPLLGGSRRSAEKRFKAACGKSILEEIIDVRFQKLMPLLEQRHVSLCSLHCKVGFTSCNQLQRQFKARFGVSLSQYRKVLR